MTQSEIRQAAFAYESGHPSSSLTAAFIQGFLFAVQHLASDAPSMQTTVIQPAVKAKAEYDEVFISLWNRYERKGNKQKAFRNWQRLTKKQKEEVMTNISAYVRATPDPQYRKNLETYLNPKNEHWNDRIVMQGQPSAEAREMQRKQELLNRIFELGRGNGCD